MTSDLLCYELNWSSDYTLDGVGDCAGAMRSLSVERKIGRIPHYPTSSQLLFFIHLENSPCLYSCDIVSS